MDVVSPRQPYAFFPQGGTVYGDLYLQNFYDLNAEPDLLDWAGTNFRCGRGNRGRLDPALFAEQDKGVPVFAALDGTVSTAIYSDLNDHNTASNAAADNSPLGNYVILDHGAGQQTGYFSLAYDNPAHPDPRYAPLQVGQTVEPELRSVWSPAAATAPARTCISVVPERCDVRTVRRHCPSRSFLVGQPAFDPARPLPGSLQCRRRQRQHRPAPSSDLPRQGTFTSGAANTGGWTILHNLPANSFFRLRWLRPDGSVYHDID